MSDPGYDALLASAYQIQAVKYVTVASLVILIYDYLLTLEREIRLMWTWKQGFGTILFFLTRYSSFIDVPMTMWHTLSGYHGAPLRPSTCLTVYSIATWVGALGIATAEAILSLRTYALFYGKKKMLVFLFSFYSVLFVADFTIAELYLHSLRFGEAPRGIQELGGCHAVDGSKIMFIVFCNIIFQETVILSLTLYRGITSFRRSRSQLLRSLYRDGVFYYVYIILISAANIIVLVTGPVDLLDFFITFQRVMHGILAGRILLHVRDALQKKSYHISTISFRPSECPELTSTAVEQPWSIGNTGMSPPLVASGSTSASIPLQERSLS